MPRQADELSAIAVKRMTHPGGKGNHLVFVGGVAGLALQLLPGGGRTWILRTVVGRKRREIGLGGYPEVSLADARAKARALKEEIAKGADPVEERKAARGALMASQHPGLLFKDAVDAFLTNRTAGFKNEKHKYQWRATLDTYAGPVIGDMTVGAIGVADVLRVLEPIWTTKTETASRLRGRIEAVLAWAMVAGHRSGENPARWRGNLNMLLAKPTKVATVVHQPAVALADASAWFADLRKRGGSSARALEFAVLTAARSGEVRLATWGELDLDRAMWTVPADRMKMERDHRVPLSDAALALVKALPVMEGSPYIFAAPRGGTLSDMSLSAVMRKMHRAELDADRKGWLDPVSGRPAVPHGLRSTFRDWAAETGVPRDMAEIALSHASGSDVERAYRRTDMLERRREVMGEWARFLEGR
ncbi:tyrosine-type recombinase/integrase [Segnochrobactraceae bacterium EtOH-i3]